MFTSLTTKAALVVLALGSALQNGDAAAWPKLTKELNAAKNGVDVPRKGCNQLTPALNNVRGAVWSDSKVDISQPWSIEKLIYVGENDSGADGIGFVLQGKNQKQIGRSGYGQGFVGIKNALVVELDTWSNNAAESKGDFLQVSHSDGSGTLNPLTSMAFVPNVEDDKEHTLKISWDGAKLKASLDGGNQLELTVSGGLSQYTGGKSDVYYGYTAATGGAKNIHYICPPTQYNGGGAKGDPHFKTWAGESYDFHGVCDLILLQNRDFANGLGLDIHIRTKKTRMWSYIHSAAVRIGNDILELMGGPDDDNFWVNKVRAPSTESIELSGYTVAYDLLSDKSRVFVIDLGDHSQIKLKAWNYMVGVHVESMNGATFDNSLGLMGTYPDGVKMSRDNSSVVDDISAFGEQWQVLDTEPMLFHDIDGPQYPQKCEIPSSVQMRRRLGETLISQEEAELACARVDPEDFDLCVFDVRATNDKSSAGAY